MKIPTVIVWVGAAILFCDFADGASVPLANSTDCEFSHLTEEDVECAQKCCLYYSASMLNGVVFSGPFGDGRCDRIDILAACKDDGQPSYPFRLVRYASGDVEETWFWPRDSVAGLRELPAWNLLTDSAPIMNELLRKAPLRKSKQLEALLSVKNNDAGEILVQMTNATFFTSKELELGYAWPESAYQTRLLSPEFGMETIPVWRKYDGPYDRQSNCAKLVVGKRGVTNVWSMARYCRDVSCSTSKRYRVHIRIWDVAGKKTVPSALCTGVIDFETIEGRIKPESVKVKYKKDRISVRIMRREVKYSAKHEESGVSVEYDGIEKVLYKYPVESQSVRKLKGKGIVGWDDLDIEYEGGHMQVFASWMLYPQDFVINDIGGIR